jgi:peptidoglycan/LPS O-acetylase OafA/YrhL
VSLGLYREKVFHILKVFHESHLLLYQILLVLALVNYYHGTGVHRITHLVDSPYYYHTVYAMVNYLSFIIGFIMVCHLMRSASMQSRPLSWLGKYSFEIYLLHMPFMVYYDIFLFRRPMGVFFFAYLVFVLLLNAMLKGLVELVNRHTFDRYKMVEPLLRGAGA